MIKINTPLDKDIIISLKVGDKVLISGTLYMARDAAHKKMIEALNRKEQLPFDIEGQIIYYSGPCPPKAGEIIGPAGPTTSLRMDAYTTKLLDLGLGGMIGKGDRTQEVVDSIFKNRSVYFAAVGGAGALIKRCIINQEITAYPELGPEALRKINVIDFPVIVAVDSQGNNLYEIEKAKYRLKI